MLLREMREIMRRSDGVLCVRALQHIAGAERPVLHCVDMLASRDRGEVVAQR